MIIPEIKLTDAEMREAVGNYLTTRGISVPVQSVERNYSGNGAFRVALEDPEEQPAQAPEIKQENP